MVKVSETIWKCLCLHQCSPVSPTVSLSNATFCGKFNLERWRRDVSHKRRCAGPAFARPQYLRDCLDLSSPSLSLLHKHLSGCCFMPCFYSLMFPHDTNTKNHLPNLSLYSKRIHVHTTQPTRLIVMVSRKQRRPSTWVPREWTPSFWEIRNLRKSTMDPSECTMMINAKKKVCCNNQYKQVMAHIHDCFMWKCCDAME